MLQQILRRLMATIPVMAVVAIAVFALLHVTPGDPAVIIAGDYATADDVAKIRSKLGLDRPFLVQIGVWLGQVVRMDLGTSIFSGLPVSTLIRQRAEATAGLAFLALLISVIVGVPLGVIAAWKQGSWVDRLVMVLAVSGFSMPVFWLGFILVYVFSLSLGWLPVQSYAPLQDGADASRAQERLAARGHHHRHRLRAPDRPASTFSSTWSSTSCTRCSIRASATRLN